MRRIVDEGTWFAVPLRSRGFAVGVVARTSSGGGVILSYFFGDVWERPPLLTEVKDLRPESAVQILRVGDLGLTDGTWPVIGRDLDWQRSEWKVPEFVRRDELSRKAWKVTYSECDANVVASEVRTGYEDTGLERDAVLGAGATEIVLTRLLTAP
ncbi:immunity 26/phosphotriesterase HocA family protein [Sorangium sp. So ce726]|uniref:immunity 26/phosphotriesterase HocA family protein n=1 Tax=Sorangium sp. So ce726 TaxID=3133319 RepID=UPI003F641E6B